MRPPRPSVDDAALALLSLALGLYRITAQPLGLDEAVTVDRARLPLGLLLRRLSSGTTDPNMSLYYALLHGELRLFGEGEASLRAPSAVFAALAVGAVCRLGRGLFGRVAGISAGLTLGLGAFFVQFAQTARSYTLVVLLVTLSSSLFAAALARPTRARLVGFALVAALAVYAHFFAFQVLAVQAVALVFARRRRAFAAPWLWAAALVAALVSPAVVCALRMGADGVIGWVAPPTLADLLRVPAALAGGSAVSLAALLAAGVYGARRSGRWRVGYVAAWFAAPVAFTFAVSFVRPAFVDYYLLVAAPGLALFGAAGVARLPSTAARVALIALVVAPSLPRLVDGYTQPPLEDWRGAAAYVASRSRGGDAVVFFPDYAARPYRYYDRGAYPFAPRPGHTAWLVVRTADASGHPPALTALEAALARDHHATERRVFPNVAVTRYAP